MGHEMNDKKKQLGKILLKQKLVTQDELDVLLESQDESGARLASEAERRGMPREALLKALSEQHGVPAVDLDQVVIPTANLELIPVDIARRHLILPILVKEDRMFLAMADPGDRRTIEEIEFVTGRKVFPYVALSEALDEVIGLAYALADGGEAHFVGQSVAPDYLRSLGIEPPTTMARPAAAPGPLTNMPQAPSMNAQAAPQIKRASRPPSVAPGGIVHDELGIDALSEKIAAAHRPFQSQIAPLPKEPEKPVRQGPPTILVVDDEDDIRNLLRRVLQAKGHEVHEASRGLEALEKVRDVMPDVILLDAMLPEVHGFDICRRIKGSQKYGHIPVIMVSAMYRGWRVAEDLRSSYGVDAFLEKPFKIQDVIMHVERALNGRLSMVEEEPELQADASEALNAGMEAYHEGNLDIAIAHVRRGVEIDPLSFELRYHLGLLLGRKEDVFDAIQQLEAAVEYRPRNFSALKNLAVLFQKAGFKMKAVEMWERALTAAPDDETRHEIKDHLVSLL